MSIQRYVDQIIEQIEISRLKANPPKYDFGGDIEAEMEAVLSEPHTVIGKVMMVMEEELPPFSALTIQQAEAILNALNACFEAYGIDVYITAKAPIDVRYELTKGLLSEETNLMPGWHYDFCNGNCDECVLRDYCDTYQRHLKEESSS